MTDTYESRVDAYTNEIVSHWSADTDSQFSSFLENLGNPLGFPSLFDEAEFFEICFPTANVMNSQFWLDICEDVNARLIDSEWGGVMRTLGL